MSLPYNPELLRISLSLGPDLVSEVHFKHSYSKRLQLHESQYNQSPPWSSFHKACHVMLCYAGLSNALLWYARPYFAVQTCYATKSGDLFVNICSHAFTHSVTRRWGQHYCWSIVPCLNGFETPVSSNMGPSRQGTQHHLVWACITVLTRYKAL